MDWNGSGIKLSEMEWNEMKTDEDLVNQIYPLGKGIKIKKGLLFKRLNNDKGAKGFLYIGMEWSGGIEEKKEPMAR